MPKGRQRSAGAASPLLPPRQQGLQAFQRGRLDQAIAIWTPLAAQDASLRPALAEAYFRRALKTPSSDDQALSDLRQALALAPAAPRYHYHLGMRLHYLGDLASASASYQAALNGGPRDTALLIALVALEQDPQADLARLPSSSAEISALLAPVQALLAGHELPEATVAASVAPLRVLRGIGHAEADGVADLWRGLAQIATGGATITAQHSLPNPLLVTIRRVYQGLALAQAGDQDSALARWIQPDPLAARVAAFLVNVSAALYARLSRMAENGEQMAAAELILETWSLPLDGPALDELRVKLLDQAAHAAAQLGNWAAAANMWEHARQLVSRSTTLGSPRPLNHNLALAYEAQEHWEAAAEAWRAMLRTKRKRKEGAAPDGLSDAQWAWVRKRVVECYKQAGRPDEAVTVFRQMIKAEPGDLDLRLQLADALLANEQDQAALNEVNRILQIDPNFAEAQLRAAELHSARGYLPVAEQLMRKALAANPERQDIRRQFAQLLLTHATTYTNYGNDKAAEPLLREGMQLDPTNFLFPLNLAHISFNLNRRAKAEQALERVLELAGDRLEAYLGVFRCWLVEEDLAQARALIVRIDAQLKAAPDLYAQLGCLVLVEQSEQPEFPSPFAAPRKPAKKPPAETPWSIFAQELIDQALALKPDDARLHSNIAASLLAVRPAMALHHASEAARLAPDDPSAQILYGMALGMSQQKREAKEQLRKAAALARKLGMAAEAQRADGLRQQVDSPFFGLSFQMGPLLGDLDPDDLYL